MKKMTIYIAAIAAVAVGLFFLIKGLSRPKQDNPEVVPGYECGGYSEQEEISEDESVLFRKVMGESAFTPLSVSRQVVAGMNYRFWCSYDDGGANTPGHCFITIYQPLQGEPVISGIMDDRGGPQMKVIIDDEGTVGRYIGEDETSYQGDIQDTYWIAKNKATTEIFRACDGQGIITLKAPSKEPVFLRPDVNSDIVGTMVHEEGFVPEVYQCLGYIRGWFLAEVDGKPGFIRESLVNWDPINTF